jgi:hypothetical protein
MNSMQFYHSFNEAHHPCVIRIMFKTGDVLRGNIKSYPEQKSIFFLSEQFTSHESEAVVKKASGGIGK